ncbi:MAG: hypothetical protein WEC00_00110 [Dongiaceae bacterium]
MALRRPREAIDPPRRTLRVLLWSTGILVLFSPAAAAILYFGIDPAAGADPSRSILIASLRIGTAIAAVAMYLLILQQAPRFGRARGLRYRLADANPKLIFALWLVHYIASWIALGLLFGRLDRDARVDPVHAEQGIGMFLLALGLLMACWAYGRFTSRP